MISQKLDNQHYFISVVLEKVTEKNRPFAEKLANIIDEMMIENPEGW